MTGGLVGVAFTVLVRAVDLGGELASLEIGLLLLAGMGFGELGSA